MTHSTYPPLERGLIEMELGMTEGLEIITVGETLHVCVTGKLTKEDYEAFAPLIDLYWSSELGIPRIVD